MATIGNTPFLVGLTFDNSTITIGGETLEQKLGSFANINHSHTVSDITGLSATLNNLTSHNYVEKNIDDSVNIDGNLTVDGDIHFKYNTQNTSLSTKINDIETAITSHTIEHLTLTCDTNVKVGYPVFITGEILGKNLNKSIITSRDCVPVVQSTGDYKKFIGVCTEVNATYNGHTTTTLNNQKYAYIKYATHGDFLFHVADSTNYNIGDIIKFDGTIVDDCESQMTYKDQKSIVGTITGIPNSMTVAVFKF